MLAIIRVAAILCLLLLSPAAHVETPAIFSALEGKWSAKGNAFSPDARAKMTWSETFAGKFYRIDYRIDMTLDGRPQSFEGVGHHQLADGERLNAYWADSTGDLHPIVAENFRNGDRGALGKARGQTGHSEYRLNNDGAALVTDWLLTADGWRQFNQATFRKGK